MQTRPYVKVISMDFYLTVNVREKGGERERNRKREWEQGKKENDRETGNVSPLHGFCWFLSSGFSGKGPSLVKMIVTILSHVGWEKNKIHWFYIYSGLSGHTQVPGAGNFMLDDAVLWIVGHFGSLMVYDTF